MKRERKTIQIATFKKIEDFLKKQNKPIFRTDIVRKLSVDYISLKYALKMLNIKTNKEGKITLC